MRCVKMLTGVVCFRVLHPNSTLQVSSQVSLYLFSYNQQNLHKNYRSSKTSALPLFTMFMPIFAMFTHVSWILFCHEITLLIISGLIFYYHILCRQCVVIIISPKFCFCLYQPLVDNMYTSCIINHLMEPLFTQHSYY